MIVLVILGIVASITVPAIVRRQAEAQNRAKIKKSMTVYDTGISKFVIENQLRSSDAVYRVAPRGECSLTSQYFKVSEFVKNNDGTDNLCRFKVSDGVWWDISDILNPTIALNKDDLEDPDNSLTFQMTADFDNNQSLRVNDRGYDPNNANVKKLWNYVLNLKTQVCRLTKQAGWDDDWLDNTIREYNSQGKMTARYAGCDSSGNNCLGSDKYDYDENGNKTAEYRNCDVNGNNCSEVHENQNSYVCE